jgi:Mrr N-terminal domain
MSEDTSNREPLPNREELFWPTLDWAMTRKSGYTGYDLKDYLAAHFNLTKEQLAQTRSDGTNRFGNLVDWATSEFTTKEIHTGWNGEKHKSVDNLYFLTPYGYVVGERRVKPRANQTARGKAGQQTT